MGRPSFLIDAALGEDEKSARASGDARGGGGLVPLNKKAAIERPLSFEGCRRTAPCFL
jgi:hypothetical protein